MLVVSGNCTPYSADKNSNFVLMKHWDFCAIEVNLRYLRSVTTARTACNEYVDFILYNGDITRHLEILRHDGGAVDDIWSGLN